MSPGQHFRAKPGVRPSRERGTHRASLGTMDDEGIPTVSEEVSLYHAAAENVRLLLDMHDEARQRELADPVLARLLHRQGNAIQLTEARLSMIFAAQRRMKRRQDLLTAGLLVLAFVAGLVIVVAM